ncbi:MAG TPA: hypothetical protein VFA39_21175 [Steroidobacteraceae bacterium]|nr:hypothetical protein [Steroidobacteraceae bacterium]
MTVTSGEEVEFFLGQGRSEEKRSANLSVERILDPIGAAAAFESRSADEERLVACLFKPPIDPAYAQFPFRMVWRKVLQIPDDANVSIGIDDKSHKSPAAGGNYPWQDDLGDCPTASYAQAELPLLRKRKRVADRVARITA